MDEKLSKWYICVMSNVMIGAVKKQQPQWVFKIYEIGDVNEESGLAEYK